MTSSFVAVMTGQGRQARRQGKSRKDCPYSSDTSAAQYWLEGFETPSVKVDPKYIAIPPLSMKCGPWEQSERVLLEKLYTLKMTIAQISEVMQRGEKAISNQISQLGLKR